MDEWRWGAKVGMLARVYWNSRLQCYSIMDKTTGLVAGHSSELALRGATFVVHPGGRQRVIESGVKNVHAFVEGVITQLPGDINFNDIWDTGVTITYNPHKHTSFVERESGFAIKAADRVAMSSPLSLQAPIGRKPMLVAVGILLKEETPESL